MFWLRVLIVFSLRYLYLVIAYKWVLGGGEGPYNRDFMIYKKSGNIISFREVTSAKHQKV